MIHRGPPPVALGLVCMLAGCAPAVPLLAGGSATPPERGDVIAGGAARVPLGSEALPEPAHAGSTAFPRSAGGGGVVPVAGSRYGVADDWDLGVLVAGTGARLEMRREIVVREGTTRPAWLLGAGVTAGWVPGQGLDGHEGEGDGWRLGLELPLLYAVEFGAVYDLWVGARLGTEHVRGDFARNDGAGTATAPGRATALRGGPVLGLGLGLRRVHFLLELTTYYEGWLGEHQATSLDGGGFVLVPAFAVRVRL